MVDYPYTAEFTLEDVDVELIAKSFATLSREMRFSRGYVEVGIRGGAVVITARARDLTSLRSLVSGITKSLYLILTVDSLH
ncbi:hypothetical protein [Vulcanisaeta thermophila]|uniref:hypothetical protein n=1 Tax=Vulcanisaeta thermophila TaxID=867917 RepID=UPI000853A549|nr:hypothetical protein [Vulcanisaeta thermophila]